MLCVNSSAPSAKAASAAFFAPGLSQTFTSPSKAHGAIASAANIGGAASAPVVAAHHNEKLVPASILMALIGYAIGNYGAFIAAWLCYKLS